MQERPRESTPELLPRGQLLVELVLQLDERSREDRLLPKPTEHLVPSHLRVELDRPRAASDAERLRDGAFCEHDCLRRPREREPVGVQRLEVVAASRRAPDLSTPLSVSVVS